MPCVKPGSVAIAAAVVLAIVLLARLRKSPMRGSARGEKFAGPYNIQLYDYPFFYPHYVARDAAAWDGDERCATYCSAPDELAPGTDGTTGCTVWCR